MEGLGYAVDTLRTPPFSVGGAKRAVAVFLDDQETFEDSGERFDGATPVAHARRCWDQQALPWPSLTGAARSVLSRPDVGAAARGSCDTCGRAQLELPA
ncbi:MAG: hypothetical protein M5U31_00320 [Acidimicrobiia bacterium]|nr:hypothetical protein [Acidimicrobiia bacterium]